MVTHEDYDDEYCDVVNNYDGDGENDGSDKDGISCFFL